MALPLAAIRRFLLRLIAFFRSRNAEAELARAIDAHLQLLEDRYFADGMSREDARLAARRGPGPPRPAGAADRRAQSRLTRISKRRRRLRTLDAGSRYPPLASLAASYVSFPHMAVAHEDDRALKKGTAELLVLAQLENSQSHGYEIAQQIAARSGGAVSFHAASLYPVLYRLERRGLIAGRWVEKSGQRRRRYYRLTSEGRKVLSARRRNWSTFMQAVQQAAGLDYA